METNLGRDYDRVFLITTDNRIVGVRDPRVPRKKKKELKKSGQYVGPYLRGIKIK